MIIHDWHYSAPDYADSQLIERDCTRCGRHQCGVTGMAGWDTTEPGSGVCRPRAYIVGLVIYVPLALAVAMLVVGIAIPSILGGR